MDKKQAFEILVQATGSVQADRKTHVAIQEALDVIKALISDDDTGVDKSK